MIVADFLREYRIDLYDHETLLTLGCARYEALLCGLHGESRFMSAMYQKYHPTDSDVPPTASSHVPPEHQYGGKALTDYVKVLEFERKAKERKALRQTEM